MYAHAWIATMPEQVHVRPYAELVLTSYLSLKKGSNFQGEAARTGCLDQAGATLLQKTIQKWQYLYCHTSLMSARPAVNDGKATQ